MTTVVWPAPGPRNQGLQTWKSKGKRKEPPPPDVRAWSAQIADGEPGATVYTLKAFLGDPWEIHPSWMRTQSRSELQEMLRDAGFDDVSGDKRAMLERYANGKPFVQFKIDSRECLQRVLAVALSRFGYDLTHAFSVHMPRRGGACLWGARSYQDDDRFSMIWDLDSVHRQADHEEALYGTTRQYDNLVKGLETGRYHGLQSTRQPPDMCLDETTVDDLLDGTIGLNELTPWREVEGSALEPGTVERGWDFRNKDQGGALALSDVALRVGDRMRYTYDFGDENKVTIVVRKIEHDQPALKEMNFPCKLTSFGAPGSPKPDDENCRPTRATVEATGGARVPRQYH